MLTSFLGVLVLMYLSPVILIILAALFDIGVVLACNFKVQVHLRTNDILTSIACLYSFHMCRGSSHLHNSTMNEYVFSVEICRVRCT